MRAFLTIISVLSIGLCRAQTLGGSAIYNFLRLPSSTVLTASGGVNVSNQPGEAAVGNSDPALLDAGLKGQLGLGFTSFLAGAKTFGADAAWFQERLQTAFGAHIFFVDYGSIPQTDAAGNISGYFHPLDYVVQVSGSRQYLEKWRYGLSIKFVNSVYQSYKSSALAVDAGILFKDTAQLLSIGLLVRNLGFQVRTYAGQAEDLPFDLELGATKRLSDAPFGFSLTLQQLHRFNILYNDTNFNDINNIQGHTSFINKIFNHFVLATNVYLGQNLGLTVGYNFLRRTELNMGTAGNGLNGFSAGFLARFQKLQFSYALSAYQRNILYHQFAISIWLNRLFGLGE